MERQISRPRTDRHIPGNKVFATRRTFKRRRRRALLTLGALTAFVLVTLGATLLYVNLLAAESGAAVARVSTPAVADAPEPVADLQAQAEEPAQEEPPAEQAAGEPQEAVLPPPEDPTLYLTVPRLGIYGHTVRNDDSQWALDTGAIKIPSTGFPWQGGANTYIAGHRIGWPGNETYYQFYNLPTMQAGDAVYLTDANGTVYTY